MTARLCRHSIFGSCAQVDCMGVQSFIIADLMNRRGSNTRLAPVVIAINDSQRLSIDVEPGELKRRCLGIGSRPVIFSNARIIPVLKLA